MDNLYLKTREEKLEFELTLKPKFKQTLHVGCPNVGNIENFLTRVKDIFKNKWFTNNGTYVRELEDKLKNYLDVKHCIPIVNGTIALEIAGRALGLSGEVIVPSFTFVAVPHSLLLQNLTPVFCDIDPKTHNLDLGQVEKLISPKTSAILAVHIWGNACVIDELTILCKKYNLKLLFDAAHAFGCSHKNRMIGNFGDAEVFSFHATKFINTFEGGAIATNDDALAEKIRLIMNFGLKQADTVICLGTNGKMSEISAAMGITGLESISKIIKVNYKNYLLYLNTFSKIKGFKIFKYNETERHNYQYVIMEIDQQKAGFTRDQLITYLHHHNILVRKYFHPGCHKMEPYVSSNFKAGSLLETNKLVKKVIAFPTGTNVGTVQIKKIAAMILDFQMTMSS